MLSSNTSHLVNKSQICTQCWQSYSVKVLYHS